MVVVGEQHRIDRVLVDERDRRLCDQLMEIHRTHRTEAIQVAVVYGAGHLPAAIEFLNQRAGYFPSSCDWLTAFHLRAR